MKRHTTLLIPGAIAALLLGACSADNDTGTDSNTDATVTAPTSQSTTATSSEAATTTDVSPAAAAAPVEPPTKDGFSLEDTHIQSEQLAEMMVEDVRAGSHEGYDRLVVELSGTGSPSVIAGYDTDPRQQASGFPLKPAGNAYFTLIIQGVPLSMSADEAVLAKSSPAGVAAGSITEIADGGVFEADAQYVVGLDKQRPYKLSVLENPTRIVVDFQK
ncbi:MULTISPECIES: AMIN-like domain-containing (lipo)protein [Corynebacterium]|uniref:AMIN-like domain-containing (lipo)protein n=1 Tax=Corynebacterium TaxID=1716 RepID=UPI0008A0FF31|nr:MULTISPECIES: hypothetical protein [Corynebacterium]MDK8240936.1 hypothetical protein [Corynebacterium coyleae]MDK8798624.1 hypothetical protein [Corynebacterium coyleae]OFL93025.1 hypothetical protein HMPREF2734_06295 [Corynebacterium sp. HMSC055D05]